MLKIHKKTIGHFDQTASQASPLLKFGPPPKSIFFDVSGDFEQKKKIFFGLRKFFHFGVNFSLPHFS